MERTVSDPLVGRRVGQYDVVAKLGGGGMGVVYAARDSRLGRLVALKFLPPQWSHDETAKQRFIREAQAASATDHRHICTIHDIDTADDGQLFIVMAHYDGETLKQRLERGALPTEEAIEIAAEVAEGLAKAHAQSVVHRDIKPGNLMLTDDGVKILDFGLAKFADALQLTIAGSTLGTVAYMSPEQARAEEADARSDLWSVGVVLYEMLAGAVPFKGAYAEAIAHAIRTDDPPPIVRGDGPIAEPLWQIVLRCLAKDPAERYQSARELARDLRLLQGRTLPLDLLTQPVRVPSAAALAPAKRRWLTRPRVIAASLLAAALIGAPLWLFAPVERISVAVVPVINQTGYAELEAYRFALTAEVISGLADSSRVRVAPYDRLLQSVRRFRLARQDVSSRDAIQAITRNSAARVMIVPTLLYEGGGWKARVELRDPATGTNLAAYETAPVASSLMKETVYNLAASLPDGIDRQFLALGPRRASLADALRRATFRTIDSATAPRLRSLDAGAELERGVSAYEQQEYADARQAFGAAAALDPRNPLVHAWRSRVAAVMRQDKEAVEAAERAAQSPVDTLRPSDRAFVGAVIAEGRGRLREADDRYTQRSAERPDDAIWLFEHAAFKDRHGSADEAVALYHRALTLDNGLVRAHLELCRLYSPSRRNEPALAREHGQVALSAFRSAGDPAGEAQALWCLADVRRAGTDEDRREARRNVEAALAIMQRLGYRYGLARARNYLGVISLMAERNGRAAAIWFEQALAGVRETGNVFLESRILMNLGASYETFGNRARAVTYYADSFRLLEALGSEQEAAWTQANAAAILVEYGSSPDVGLRDAQNALVVFRRIGDKDFEVFSRRTIATYYRNLGNFDAALRELTIALTIAKERNLDSKVTEVTLDTARVLMETGDYAKARQLLRELDQHAIALDHAHARIELARIEGRLGHFADATAMLMDVATGLRHAGDTGTIPLLRFAEGEVAYEAGRFHEARAAFTEAARMWDGDFPEASSVEAQAFVGLLTALDGDTSGGRRSIAGALGQAEKMRRVLVATRCRVFLARIALASGHTDDATAALAPVTNDIVAALGSELRAQVHYWRSRALSSAGNSAAMDAEAQAAQDVVNALQARLAPSDRDGFLSRTDIRLLTQRSAPKVRHTSRATRRIERWQWPMAAATGAATAASTGKSTTTRETRSPS